MKQKCLLLITFILSVFLVPNLQSEANSSVNASLSNTNTISLDFDNLQDLEAVTDQYSNIGVAFEGAKVLSQGGHLNYLHYPPRSGLNVVYDDPYSPLNGRIIVSFDSGVTGIVSKVGGYVTGKVNVRMTAFDMMGNQLSFVETGGPNYDPGDEIFFPPPIAEPNMRLEIESSTPIAQVVFSDTGNTYTVDDFYFESEQTCQILSVPLFKQADPSWANDRYGGTTSNPWRYDDDHDGHLDEGGADTPETISKWGCALTSSAMLISYFGQQQNGFTTSPRELNTWLKNQPTGYINGGDINWIEVARYAREVGHIQLYHYAGWGPDDGVVNSYICNSSPIILATNSPPYINGHFVLATGQTGPNLWAVQDPGGYDVDSIGSDSYTSFRKYGTTETEPTELLIAVYSPLELLVTDPAGRITGYNPADKKYYNEILDANYMAEYLGARDESGSSIKSLKFNTGAPLSGEYLIQLVGTGVGNYEIELIAYDSQGNSSKKQLSGIIFKDKTLDLRLVYSDEPGSQLEVEQITFFPKIFLPSISN